MLDLGVGQLGEARHGDALGRPRLGLRARVRGEVPVRRLLRERERVVHGGGDAGVGERDRERGRARRRAARTGGARDRGDRRCQRSVRRRRAVVSGDRAATVVARRRGRRAPSRSHAASSSDMRKFCETVVVHVLLGHAVRAQQPDGRRRRRRVVGDHGAAVADAAEVLGRVEAVDGGRRAASGRAPRRAPAPRPRRSAGRCRGSVGRTPVQVHHDDGPRAVGARRVDQPSRRAPPCRRSTSTSTGVAPSAATADAVGTAVNAGTITSSPGPTPSARERQLQRGGAGRRRRRRAARRAHAANSRLERGRLAAEQERAAGAHALRRRRANVVGQRSRRAGVRSTTGTTGAHDRRRAVRRMPVVELDRRLANRARRRWRAVGPERADVDALVIGRATGSGPDRRCRRRARSRSRAISASEWSTSLPTLYTRPTAASAVAATNGVDDVVDVQAVAALAAVAEELDRLAPQRRADEHRQEPELVAGQALSRAVHVGQAQRRDRPSRRPGRTPGAAARRRAWRRR